MIHPLGGRDKNQKTPSFVFILKAGEILPKYLFQENPMKRRGTIKVRGCFALAALLLGLAGSVDVLAKNMFAWRIVHKPDGNFKTAAGVQMLVDLMKRMSAAGYNSIILEGGGMLNPSKTLAEDPLLKANIQSVVAEAKRLGIVVVPNAQSQGSTHYLDSTRDEGFASPGTRFKVSGGEARAVGDPDVFLKNPGFEEPLAGSWAGSMQFFRIDSVEKHSGNASLRCDDPTVNYCMVKQPINVKPFRTYKLSGWVKSRNIVATGIGSNPMRGVKFTVPNPQGQYLLNTRDWTGVKRNANWKPFACKFNSLTHTRVYIWLNTTTSATHFTGTVWFDDLAITEVGLYETVRRESLPVVVKSAGASAKVYTEGVDYIVGDQKLVIPAGSSTSDGEELLVDWFTAANTTSRGTGAFCHDNTWNVVRSQIAAMDQLFDTPPAYQMKYDEWRVGGWDPLCIAKYRIDQIGSGPYMAEVAKITAGLYKEANCSRLGFVYNDMYDPYHNSKKTYYVINGGTVGGGFALPDGMIITNWMGPTRPGTGYTLQIDDTTQVTLNPGSVSYFAGTNPKEFLNPLTGKMERKTTRQPQIICARFSYAWTKWLPLLDSMEQDGLLPDGSVIGIDYFSYKGPDSYDERVELMAEACRNAGRWLTGPPPVPEAKPGCPYTITYPGISRKNRPSTNHGLHASLASTGGFGNAVLRFSISQDSDVRLSVFNLKGQLIHEVVNQRMLSGSHQRRLDTSKMSSGVYFASLRVDDGRAKVTKKVVLF